MTKRKIRVVVADDHPLFRGGVSLTMQEAGDIEVVGECDSAETVVVKVRETLPDVVLLDISMPGNGLTAARKIGLEHPEVRILMLTVSEQDEDVLNALRSGAAGYVLKGVDADALVDAVRNVHRGESYISPGLAGRVLLSMNTGVRQDAPSPDPISALTHREVQILRLVARGMSNREVGRELDLREATVKHYMTNILEKLQVRNRVEAALLAREEDI